MPSPISHLQHHQIQRLRIKQPPVLWAAAITRATVEKEGHLALWVARHLHGAFWTTHTGFINLHPKHSMWNTWKVKTINNRNRYINIKKKKYILKPTIFGRPHNTSYSFHPSSPGAHSSALRSPGRDSAHPDTRPLWRCGATGPGARPRQHQGTGQHRGSSAAKSGGPGPSNGRRSWRRDTEGGKLGCKAWSQSWFLMISDDFWWFLIISDDFWWFLESLRVEVVEVKDLTLIWHQLVQSISLSSTEASNLLQFIAAFGINSSSF